MRFYTEIQVFGVEEIFPDIEFTKELSNMELAH